MNNQVKARLEWVKLYEAHKDAGFVCRRCGISRPTLRKWVKRYQKEGVADLMDLNKRPHNSPNRKLNEENRAWIIELRNTRNLGVRRIKNELLRLHS